jgi:hypothetical protein
MVLISIIKMIYRDFHAGLINFLLFYKSNVKHKSLWRAAFLDPGHAKQIGKGNEGNLSDDFEGTKSSIDLRFPLISWTMSSTPQKH